MRVEVNGCEQEVLVKNLNLFCPAGNQLMPFFFAFLHELGIKQAAEGMYFLLFIFGQPQTEETIFHINQLIIEVLSINQSFQVSLVNPNGPPTLQNKLETALDIHSLLAGKPSTPQLALCH